MKFTYISAIILLLFSSCSKKVTTIEVVRKPLLQFTIDSAVWTAENYTFLAPSRVVQYPSDTSLPGRLYNHFTLQGTGKDTKGNNLQLIVVFDVVDNLQLVGTYHPSYSTTKGLNSVQVFNLDNNNLAAYSICDTAFSMLQVRKQSIDEKLIAGSFQALLCNIRDSTKKITITNGIINDINYR